MITSAELAERMKAEIVEDVLNGIVPENVAGFSELHDYVDANVYGGTEGILAAFHAHATTDAEHVVAWDAFCDLCNPAIETVNGWIKAGGLKAQVESRRRSESI